MAKLGGRITRFGGILDSVCDRVSDAALFLGALFYFVLRPGAPGAGTGPNLTAAVLAGAGLVWAYLTSYTKARAENVVPGGSGGFWQRGERVVTFLIGTAFAHVATIVWILGLWPLATVAHRVWRAREECHRLDRGEVADEPIRPRGILAVLLWRYERGTVPFDLHAGTVIALLVALEYGVDLGTFDPLGAWLL
jgi:phosphatidylglycerophosphate synthase